MVLRCLTELVQRILKIQDTNLKILMNRLSASSCMATRVKYKLLLTDLLLLLFCVPLYVIML